MQYNTAIVSPGRSRKFLVYVISALLLIAAIALYLHFPSGYNQGLYHYQGLVLKHGGLPYSDFVEKKGVLALLVYSLASLLFGEASWAYRLFDLLVLTGTGIVLFSIVKSKYSHWLAVLAVGIWGSHVLIEAPGNTGDVTNLITLFTLILSKHLINDKKPVNYLSAGLLMAFSCWVKPTAILIYLPLIVLFSNRFDTRFQWSASVLIKVLTGLLVPTILLGAYLFISGTFRTFWEALVLEPYLHYAHDKFRLSIWAIKRTAYHFIQDPLLRAGGILSLFLIKGERFLAVLRLLVIGVFTMVITEGQLFPYHFSILWPLLTIGFIHGLHYLSNFLKTKSYTITLIGLLIILHIPIFQIGLRFQKAGFLTADFNPEEVFIIEDFKEMYRFRESVTSYLKPLLSKSDEIFVFGRDPNIYLQLGAVTSCRFARESFMLTETETESTSQLIRDWKMEYLSYLESGKAVWLIVLKTIPDRVNAKYKPKIKQVLTEVYRPIKETKGHIIYKRR